MSELLDQSLERIPVNQSIIGQKVLESLRSRLATNFLSTLIAATLIFGVIWYHEKNQVYLAWYLLTIFIILSRLFENAFYKKHIATGNDSSLWKDRFDIGTLASGATWGFVASVIAPVFEAEINTLILLFCCGLLSAAVVAYQASLRSYLMFALPIVISIAVVYTQSNHIVDMTIGIGMLCFVAILSTYLVQINRRFIDHIKLQADNERLISTLKYELEEHEISKQALSESEERYQDFFDNANDVIYKTDARAYLIYVNKMAEQSTGYSRNDLLRMQGMDLIAPDYRFQVKKLYLEKIRAGVNEFKHEAPIIRKDGEIIWGEMNVQCVFKNEKIKEYRIVVREITERKKIEQALRSAELLTRQILDSAGEGIYGLDLNGKTTFTNPAAAEMVGRKPDDLIGKPQHALVHHTKVDGSPYPREACPIYAAISDGKVHHATDEVFWRKDGSSFPVEYTSTPIIENDMIKGAVVVFQDITRRKENENKLLKAKEEAMSAKVLQEQFVANISHEIRTPMNAVTGFVDLLSRTKISKEQKEYLDGLGLSSERLLNVINDLLDMSKIQSGKLTFHPSELNIVDAINSIITTLRPQADAKKLKIDIKLKGSIPKTVMFDPLRFDQIMQNLLSNAVKYTHKGKVQVIIESLLYEGHQVKLKISVKDTGTGIPEDTLGMIFDDFHQMHNKPDEYHGTGLGLAIVKKLVKLRGGDVFSISKLNKGSTIGFVMWFDISEGVVKTEEDTDDTTLRNANNKRNALKSFRLLVADDNEMNLMIIKKFMQDYTDQITIDTVVNGAEALKKVQSDKYDLVFMDLQMPEMNGFEASREIRKLSGSTSKIPIIALTAALPPTVNLYDAGINDFLLKPFTRDALYEKTDQILEL